MEWEVKKVSIFFILSNGNSYPFEGISDSIPGNLDYIIYPQNLHDVLQSSHTYVLIKLPNRDSTSRNGAPPRSPALDFTAAAKVTAWSPSPRVFVCDQHKHTAFLLFLIA